MTPQSEVFGGNYRTRGHLCTQPPNGDGQGHITRRMGVHELSRLICCLLELLGLFCPIFRTVRFHMCIQQTCVSIYTSGKLQHPPQGPLLPVLAGFLPQVRARLRGNWTSSEMYGNRQLHKSN